MENSFFWAGFECSTQRRSDGVRLDLTASTGHDRQPLRDYELARQAGLGICRDGLRWFRIDQGGGRYDWSSADPMIEAAARAGVTVAWDLCHFGWPDDLDIWSDDFSRRLADFAVAASERIARCSGKPAWLCPINEISYFAWAAGDADLMAPGLQQNSYQLKKQLVRAAIAAAKALRSASPLTRFLWAEPAICVHPAGLDDHATAQARNFHAAQFQAYDMLMGRLHPELGGADWIAPFIGINYYPYNQWVYGGAALNRHDPQYRPLSTVLLEYHDRYRRPIVLTETGAEGIDRVSWLRYVAEEIRAAQALGVQIDAACLYPITDYPAWSGERHCISGLFSSVDARGKRAIHAPLLWELQTQQALMRVPPNRQTRLASGSFRSRGNQLTAAALYQHP